MKKDIPGVGSINFPDQATEEQILDFLNSTPLEELKKIAAREAVSAAPYNEGRAESNPLIRGGLNAIQGPSFGFGDELAGVVGGVYNATTGPNRFKEEYTKARDYSRGVQDQYKEDFPVGSVATQLMTAAPTMMFGGGAGTATQMPSLTANTARSVGLGTGFGALGAAGESKYDPADPRFYKDVAIGGGSGGVMSGAAGVAPSVWRAGKQQATRLFPRAADSRGFAQEKVAEAVIRGMPESAGATPLNQAQAKMVAMGPEARLADVSQSTRGLLDVTATAPGRTGDRVNQAIRERVIGEPKRLLSGGEAAMGQRANLFDDTLDNLDAARKTLAAPYYNVVDKAVVTVDDQMHSLLQRTKSAHSEAESLMKMEGLSDDLRLAIGKFGDDIDSIKLSNLAVGDKVPFKMMDTLKKSMDDFVSKANREGLNNRSRVTRTVNEELVEKLKDISPKVGKQSAYAQALEQWAGPSKLMDAMETGASVFTARVPDLKQEMAKITAGEMEAFRMGAAQALKEKVGMQGGRTELINAWKNPNTADRLRLIFGNDFRKFQRTLLQEEKLRPLASVGKGSQTAARMLGAEDMGMNAMEAAGSLASMSSGSPASILQSMVSVGRKLQTPEPVRNEIGNLLLNRDQQSIARLSEYVRKLNEQRRLQSIRTGVGGGLGATQLGSTQFFGAQ